MIDFSYPNQVDVIIYGKRGDFVIKKIIKNATHKFISNQDKFNFIVLIKTVFKFKFSFSGYLEEYINIINPTLLISNIDNEPFLWSFKSKYPKLNVILIQFAVRSRVQDLFGIKNIENLYDKKNAFVDYFFVFNNNIINEYKKLLNANFLTIGSIINNDIIANKNTRNNEISFISQYRPNQKIYPAFVIVNDIKISKETFYNTESYLLPILLKYCKNNYLKLSIIACSNEPEEMEFYDKIIGKNEYIFYPKKDLLTSYQLMTSSLLNVCVDSTMGYESFSRGIKTVFISNRSNDLCEDSAKFGWPGKFPNFGKFWLNDLNEIKIIEVLNSVYKMNNNDFQKLVLNNSENIMCYDKGNALLEKVVNKILNERN